MDLFDKIDSIFKASDDSTPPLWAKEILDELKEIKLALSSLNYTTFKETQAHNTRYDKDYMSFVNSFRTKMKPDTLNDIYPEFIYQDQKIGVNLKGHLYYKDSGLTIDKEEAFKIYRWLYEQENRQTAI